ncbi:MAG: DNA adenine methylase [Clostridia bacterium]|nr:DNA adenine methylase [Clostridia bacterium]
MKPFIKYPGGKIKEFPLVDRFKPEKISRYFEPFVGGAAIYLNIDICDSYINDKSKDLSDLYQYIKFQDDVFFQYIKELDRLWKIIDNADTLTSSLCDIEKFDKYFNESLVFKIKKIKRLENSGYIISQSDKDEMVLTAKKTAFYMCIRDLYNRKGIEQAKHTAYFYFIREYCYSSMFRFSREGNFNVPYGGRSYNLKYMTSKIEQMQSNETIKYFENTSIYNLDFEDFLNLFKLNQNDFIFLDPPYDSGFSTYDQHLFDKKEQIRLLEFLKKTQAKWMMIIKKTDFIYDMYKDFYILEYDKNYLVSFKNRNIKDVKHLLITNYAVEV